MYEDHYGLSGRPFQLTPDPDVWFESATHRKAMAYLGYGLAQGEGFVVITGEVGAGKTTLVGHLMETLDRDALHVVQLVSTQVGDDDILRLATQALGLESEGLAKAQLLDRIERQLHAIAREGRRTLLIVDEAQSLATSAIEELRMLSNFTSGGHALLQIVLLGQPEFRAALQGDGALEQLRQRIIATHHLDPMEPEEVEPYLAHRLAHVGWRGRPDFTPGAAQALHRASRGIPRVINQLAGRAMMQAAVENSDVIDTADIEGVVADREVDMPSSPKRSDATVRVAAEPSVAETSSPAALAELGRRVEELEARLEEQDVALRRVLQLLVDWVEDDSRQRAELDTVRGTAA